MSPRTLIRALLLLASGLGWFLSAGAGALRPVDDPELAVGQWRTHLPLNKVSCVEKVGTRVYAGCTGGIFVFDTEDGSLERITRVNGLNDVEDAVII